MGCTVTAGVLDKDGVNADCEKMVSLSLAISRSSITIPPESQGKVDME